MDGLVLYGFQKGSSRPGSLSGIFISGNTSGLGGAITAAVGAGLYRILMFWIFFAGLYVQILLPYLLLFY